MSAVIEIMDRAREADVRLTLEDGQLAARGPRRGVEQFLPILRKHKPELLSVLTAASPSTGEVSGHWLILQPPQQLEMYFTPPATRSELAERYPGALLVCLPDTTDPPPLQYRAKLDDS